MSDDAKTKEPALNYSCGFYIDGDCTDSTEYTRTDSALYVPIPTLAAAESWARQRLSKPLGQGGTLGTTELGERNSDGYAVYNIFVRMPDGSIHDEYVLTAQAHGV